MKINIVYPGGGWILYKFAKSVYDELQKMGFEATLSEDYDPKADINHFFVGNYAYPVNDRTSFMITHINNERSLQQVLEQTRKGGIGICMSLETRDKLISFGVNPSKICYINPAQDGQIKPKKVALGFTHRIYDDCRKRESMILDICKKIDPNIFKFLIMGAGWESIISELVKMGFEVDYYPDFDKEKYNDLFKEMDYYCYFGFDEGSMGYLDAVAAGIGTIVTPQGYHIDTEYKITYPVKTIDEIIEALLDIQRKKEVSIRFSELWTWKNYTLKHIEIWNYMLGLGNLKDILSTRGWYNDGIYSLLLNDLDDFVPLKDKIKEGKERRKNK